MDKVLDNVADLVRFLGGTPLRLLFVRFLLRRLFSGFGTFFLQSLGTFLFCVKGSGEYLAFFGLEDFKLAFTTLVFYD